ncbi:PREDICTED: lysozyme G-like isoform X1 [Branchiostoma belcheri]|uniref:Lysozyme g n=1 Tax=Branchiostoma belcheri TaxID=7741 RepID=A0A6P4ZBF7_BRABE|nr:PREDICTED: lysozyme G-like isoform X1 [Branchiostoma belcheri]
MKGLCGLVVGLLLVTETLCGVREDLDAIKCVRRRSLDGVLGRSKRCAGGSGGGGGIERITVIGQPIHDPFIGVISDPGAIRDFLDNFGGNGGGLDHGEGGGGGPAEQQQDQDCFGDVDKVDTTGASQATAGQDGLSTTGVDASNALAQNDLNRLNQYKNQINAVSKATGMDAAIIAAIISRESRAGNALQNGYGDHGNGFGLMQIDRRYHNTQGAWDSTEHLTQAVGILQGFIQGVSNCHPSWNSEEVLKGGISAYNAGVGNVRSYDRMDVGTTGNDYANDVIARAKYLKSKGFGDPKDQECQGGSNRRRRSSGCPYSWYNPLERPPSSSGSLQSGGGGGRHTAGVSGPGYVPIVDEFSGPRCTGFRCRQIP